MGGMVCIDSHVMIWAIKEESAPGQEFMIPKAKAFLKWLDKTDVKVIVPSVVVAEFLMRIPPEIHTTINNLIQRNFISPPFDLQAAAHFSRIWQARKSQKVLQDLIDNGKTRQELKADSMIVATALARGASLIYSHDEGLKKFAEGYIRVLEIPDVPEQKQLF
jgi:predicted nucleic acid-binding protein